MLEHIVQPHLGEVADRGREGRHLGDRLSAGLEALRRGHELGLLHGHRGDHGSAGEHRRQSVEQLGLAPQRTQTGGSERLVSGECREVDVEVDEVHGHMRDGLAGVEDDVRSDGAGPFHEAVDRVDRAEDVGDVRERQHLRRLVDDRVEIGQVEFTESVTGSQRSCAPVEVASCCHGTRFAWCSISVTTIESPGTRAKRSLPLPRSRGWPDPCRATMLSASVAFFVQHTCSGVPPTSPAAAIRPFSNASVASTARECAPRWTAALRWPKYSTKVSMTHCGFCDVAPGVEIRQRRLPDPHIEDREVAPQT
jgi:hypothetical protein